MNALDTDICSRCKSDRMTCHECMELSISSREQDCHSVRLSQRIEMEDDELILLSMGVVPWDLE